MMVYHECLALPGSSLEYLLYSTPEIPSQSFAGVKRKGDWRMLLLNSYQISVDQNCFPVEARVSN